MGGVEDDEPPSKRVKVSSRELGGLSKGISVREQGGCPLSDSMARLVASQEDDEVVGSKGLIKKVEFVRIIAEALYSLGYSKTGARLEEESGIPLRSSQVELFVQQILDGKWDESIMALHEINQMDETIIKLASFVILEHKYFELLDGGEVMNALTTLRTEIAPLSVNDGRVRELSYFIVSPSEILLDRASCQESRFNSRKKLLDDLQKLLPPTVIIPENRLVHLVEQALDLQRDGCRFHNSSVGEMSLLTDHQCGRDQIPCQTLQDEFHRLEQEAIAKGEDVDVNLLIYKAIGGHDKRQKVPGLGALGNMYERLMRSRDSQSSASTGMMRQEVDSLIAKVGTLEQKLQELEEKYSGLETQVSSLEEWMRAEMERQVTRAM